MQTRPHGDRHERLHGQAQTTSAKKNHFDRGTSRERVRSESRVCLPQEASPWTQSCCSLRSQINSQLRTFSHPPMPSLQSCSGTPHTPPPIFRSQPHNPNVRNRREIYDVTTARADQGDAGRRTYRRRCVQCAIANSWCRLLRFATVRWAACRWEVSPETALWSTKHRIQLGSVHTRPPSRRLRACTASSSVLVRTAWPGAGAPDRAVLDHDVCSFLSYF